MLLALTAAFAMSQAYRTIAAMMATPLQAEFGLSAQELGVFAAAFHFAFGAMQLFMGIGIDLHGVRRTVLVAFPLAVIGSVLAAAAPHYGLLLLGQVLIGIGCAPAFLACTVFVARHFPIDRFAAVSGVIMGIGGIGLLATGTPLAWLVQTTSWRMGFWVLGACSVAAWWLIWWLVREPVTLHAAKAVPRESIAEAVRRFGALFLLPHTLGIMLLAAVTYASFLALRGLWLGPLLIQRHGFSLLQSGNVALLVSLVALISPPLFGRLDPGPLRRRAWIIGFTLVLAAVFTALALAHHVLLDVGGTLLVALLSGYIVLQYADVRAAYAPAMTGRALAVFTMAMFLGVALVQWLTGLVASMAAARGADPFTAVLLAIALLLA
ncbi:MAG: MFS transporter, partial [Microbacteriaceae bacterium]|nr:MFS transporter [Burkholderiaceae bacterium]